MLIVPEIRAIFLFPPRTGSDTLCIELMRMHPAAFLLYRHGEADLVPPGYESWRKVGFVRHPLARLWSVFKRAATLSDMDVPSEYQAERDRVAKSIEGKSFEQWVLTNDELFLPIGTGVPTFHQAHPLPETIKSQWITLRPDLGTVILKFQDLPKHMQDWGLDHSKRNGATPQIPVPKMTNKLKKHMLKHFAWDMSLTDLEVL